MLKCVLASTFVAMATSCCFPPQWEADFGFLTGNWEYGKQNGSSYQGTARMSFDAANKIATVAQRLTVNDQYEVNQTLVLDYNQNSMFVINAKGGCEKYLLGPFPPQCFSDDDVVRINFGFGSNSVKASGFNYTVNETTTYMLVAADTCAPLTTNAITKSKNVYQTTTTVYTGVKLGIADRRVFNVPTSCTNVVNTQIPGVITKRSLFF